MTETILAPSGPLQGIRVIELGQYIAGPYAAKLLGDLGADVIKVEAPDGDPMRRWQGTEGYSPQFAAYNRNKRSVVLDLKTDEGLSALLSLAESADVLLENFRPGVADRLGFGPAVLAERNPRLISCAITGFGSVGPMAARPSYDTVISAVGGMYSQIVPADSVRPLGPAFSDLLAGQAASQAVLAALVARGRTGVGESISVPMVGALIDFLTESASTFLQTGEVSHPDSRPRRAQAYGFTGSDGRAFIVHLSVPEKFWTGLLDVIERPDLADDDRFSSREGRVRHYDELDRELKSVMSTRPRAEWFSRLEAADIPHGPLNTVADLFDDPQIASMELVENLTQPDGTTVRIPRHSVDFSASARPVYRAAPLLGADTAAVLADLPITEGARS
ncbi:MAG: CoA transferase [Microcella sp.]|uniref:CaiB/BaiF CoA transferase family protein n=1 Tax=Microcella sp. TaxID=1913979 RepID=UPI0024C992F1|nr:CaiB/BaiF CoA-transferase family protein [Microcella sp.]UYN83813.1 MAG: CoA transferase [Microcella sp.]